MTVVGLDISTFRIDLAWLDVWGRPARWHLQLGSSKVPVQHRVRAAHAIQWPCDEDGTPGGDLTHVGIEYPYSINWKTGAHLMAIVGACTAVAPSWTRVGWPSSKQVRAALGAANKKPAAQAAVRELYPGGELEGWNEHELDALVVCRGYMRLLELEGEQ